MAYEDARAQIVEQISRGDRISVDTNVIIEAIESDDRKLLNELLAYPGFLPDPVLLNELFGLSKKGHLDARTRRNMQEYATRLKAKGITRVKRARARAIEEELRRYAPLVPRSVATHVVLIFVDKLIQKYTELLPKARSLTVEDMESLQQSYQTQKENLRPMCEQRYIELLDELEIPEFDEEAYFQEVEKFIRIFLSEIEKTVKQTSRISEVKSLLEKYRKKKHNEDIKLVSKAIATGATTVSQDSDVLWLLTFFSLSRAA